MSFTVIDNDAASKTSRRSGFRNAEFKKLAGLYSQAVSRKLMYDMAVDVNMDEGLCRFSYFRAPHSPATITFVVRHVGPQADLYEVWVEKRGMIFKSGLFARAFERLEEAVESYA